jgi:EAL domain-containing protein (putative c-di-GMP-specific phosphodiesterase class I)
MDIDQIISDTKINPEHLKLEITESTLMENAEVAIYLMTELRSRNIQISIDDFGTGYSSLAYLKRLPLDQLKIDRSFVRDVLTDPNDAAIARTILQLAQSLDLDVVAEGVETEEQRAFLQEIGCHTLQGYFIAKPLTVEALEHWLMNRST